MSISCSRSGTSVGAISGSLFAQRSGVNAGNEESGQLVEGHHLVAADEREIEIARARTIRVERRAVLPALTGDGAPAQDDAGAWRNRLRGRCPRTRSNCSWLPPNARRIDVVALLFCRQLLGGRAWVLLLHRPPALPSATRAPIYNSVSGGAGWATNAPGCHLWANASAASAWTRAQTLPPNPAPKLLDANAPAIRWNQ